MSFESLQSSPEISPKRRRLVQEYVDTEAHRVDNATRRRLGSYLERARLNREQITHNNLDIDFLGVAHEPETLLKYREEIDRAIRQADFVVIEAVLNIGGDMSTSTAKLAENRDGTAAPDVFFGEIENIARKYGKKIISMDASTSAKNLNESGHDMNLSHMNEEEQLQSIHRGVGVAGVVVAGATALMEQGDVEITRRGFLKGMTAYTAGTLASVDGVLNGTKIGYYGTTLKMPLHGGQDYRDVVLAEGVDILSRKFSKKMKVAMIYGAAHATGFKTYLESPTIRQVKRRTYKGFDEVDAPEMRGYVFHEGGEQDRSEWQETFRVKI